MDMQWFLVIAGWGAMICVIIVSLIMEAKRHRNKKPQRLKQPVNAEDAPGRRNNVDGRRQEKMLRRRAACKV